MARINQKTFKEALKNSGGNQARIAEKLEVTRQAVGLYLSKNPKMRELLDHEAEFVIDIAEDNINTDIIVHKSIKSSRWKLINSKRGKARGWGPKQEMIHSGEIEGGKKFFLIEKSVEEIKDAKDGIASKSKADRDSQSSGG